AARQLDGDAAPADGDGSRADGFGARAAADETERFVEERRVEQPLEDRLRAERIVAGKRRRGRREDPCDRPAPERGDPPADERFVLPVRPEDEDAVVEALEADRVPARRVALDVRQEPRVPVLEQREETRELEEEPRVVELARMLAQRRDLRRPFL